MLNIGASVSYEGPCCTAKPRGRRQKVIASTKEDLPDPPKSHGKRGRGGARKDRGSDDDYDDDEEEEVGTSYIILATSSTA